MTWKNVELLEVVEAYAEGKGWASSEEEVSALFDAEVAPLVVKQHLDGDQVVMNQAFNDWVYAAAKEGRLHPEQRRAYCYVGKYLEQARGNRNG